MDALKFSVFDCETIPSLSLPDDLRPQPDLSKVKYGNTKNPFDRAKIEAAYVADHESKLDKIMSLDPYLCQVCVLVGYNSWTNTFMELQATNEEEEAVLLREFWEWLHVSYSRDIPIVGFNSASFDFPVLVTRSMLHDVSVNPAMYRDMMKRQDGGYQNHHHIDLMQRLGYRDAFSGKLVMRSLDWNCRRFGITSPKQDGMDGSKVYPMFQEGRLPEILEYCKQDVLATAQLFERVAPWIYREPPKSFDTQQTREASAGILPSLGFVGTAHHEQ